ncbi:MAG: L-threonine 3-dehydrogenase [Clostridia bacterium]|nr:L-threonine 3-dehydrogenase [Clostridia bacterium]
MDALVKRYPARGLELEQVDIPVLGENEALVKIKKTAICGTDLHIYNYDEWTAKTVPIPMVIGHEFVGEIVEIKGKSERHFKVGDIVCAEGHITCGNCRACRAGRLHLCPNTKGIGVNRQGIFAQYAAIPLANLWLTDNNISQEMYSIFDPFGNATHTALTYNLVGEDVLIIGAGPIGIMAAAISCHVGARNVVITDVNQYRLDLAKKVAPRAIVVDTTKTSLHHVQKEIGMTEGFDVGMEMSGNKYAFAEMIDNMIMGGNVALLAMPKADTQVDWNKVVFGALNIKGIYGRKIFETWHAMTSMLQSGLDISSVITHRFDYKDYIQGFELMDKAQCGKVILNWEK